MKLAKKIFGETLFTKLMKATFYGHFVAGEDEVQITPVLDRLRQFGVKPILDYSVEEDISQEEAERREIQYVPTVTIFLSFRSFCDSSYYCVLVSEIFILIRSL